MTAAGTSDTAQANNQMGSKKYGHLIPVENNRFYLPPNTRWISHISLGVRGDPDTDLRVVETYINSSSSATNSTTARIAGYGPSSHYDWTGYTEYTQYSGFCMFTVPVDQPWLTFIQVAKTRTADHSVRFTGLTASVRGSVGGISFQRIK